jgi:hypothetical protein
MTDSSQIVADSEQAIIKLKNSLDQLLDRNIDNNDASALLADAMSLFKSFFDNIGNPEFNPIELKTGDTPRSADYNSNLKQIFNDISRFYKEIQNLNNANIKSFNYSQVVTNEIKKRAESIAGIVLDLNILNGFTRGDVIVAGDDFINFDKVDQSAGLSASKVELISNGSGISLARSGSNNLTSDSRIKIQVIPLTPQGGAGQSAVNTAPTPGNFNRFYEGSYYALLGQARPEGGRFNIQNITVPPSPPTSTETNGDGGAEEQSDAGGQVNSAASNLSIFSFKKFFKKKDKFRRKLQGKVGKEGSRFFNRLFKKKKKQRGTNEQPAPPPPAPSEPESYFLEYGASEEEKELARRKMLDNNPDTFWECEYIVSVENPLLPDITESLVVTESPDSTDSTENSTYADADSPTAAAIQIDVNNLNLEAVERDTLDFTIDIVVTLPQQQNVNFVSINPVLFSKNAFVDVVDISTASEEEGVFITVDGWESLRFAKTITPEANEYLTDSQVEASLAPSRFNYTGQGIYPFPTTIAKKIKVTLLMKNPTAQIYEKTYALLRNVLNVETTVTTTKTKKKFI